MSVFEDIKTGLNEAISFEKGKGSARVSIVEIIPVASFTAQEIKEIRTNACMTQKAFSAYMGVSVKTVEAWESGRNHPDGSACRLLSLTQQDPMFPRKSGIVAI